MGAEGNHPNWCLRRFDPCRCHHRAFGPEGAAKECAKNMALPPTQEPVMSTRLQLVEVLEELRDVLVQIDNQAVDRRYVDFAALAERLDECIENVQELPHTVAAGD